MNNDTSKATMNHTPEPWAVDWQFIVAPDPNGIYPDIYIAELAEDDSSEPPRIASPEAQVANGRRIVAAVNACKGIPTEALEQGIIEELIEMLASAVVELEEWLIGFPKDRDDMPEDGARFSAILVKVRGETPTAS